MDKKNNKSKEKLSDKFKEYQEKKKEQEFEKKIDKSIVLKIKTYLANRRKLKILKELKTTNQETETVQETKNDQKSKFKFNLSYLNLSYLKNLFLKTQSKELEKVEKELDKVDKKDKIEQKRIEDQRKKELKIKVLSTQFKRKKEKLKQSRYQKLKNLKGYLEKAGYQISDESSISRKINYFSFFLMIIFSGYLFYLGIFLDLSILYVIVQVIASWIVILPAIIIMIWGVFYFAIDMKIYNRTKQLEEVLPDFLQLTSANINAGMTLDKALWYAVRPRFGILAKEIESVAKSTLVGDDLKDSLLDFSKRYDSKLLKRAVNLILEGIDAGGEIGPLLNKIAIDIQETRIIKKDMAANVTTYVIFISFATVAAAPFLFALSTQVLAVITSLMGNLDLSGAGSSMSMFSFEGSSISMRDFKIFAMSTLAMTSFFSAAIVSIIQKGNIKDGLKYIPTYITISITLYLISVKVLGFFLGGLL